MFAQPDLLVRDILFVIDRQTDAHWLQPLHANEDHFVLTCILDGAADFLFGLEECHVQAGDILLLKQSTLYSVRSDPDTPWRYITIGFRMECLNDEAAEVLQQLPEVFPCPDNAVLTDDFHRLNQLWNTPHPGSILKCRSILNDLVYQLLQEYGRDKQTTVFDARMEAIVQMLRADVAHTWTLEELSEQAGLSPSHFRALFKQHTGTSCIQFQLHQRVAKARELLLSHSCSVNEAAEAVGFTDVYYFARMFRKIIGQNPFDLV